MELTNRFTLPVPPDRAWDLLLDFSRVAQAMPGATLDRVHGDELEGRMLVKLGPMRITYEGTASIVERDQPAGRIVIEAAGKEARGAGTAKVRIQTHLVPVGSGTEVTLLSEVDVTGRPAQMGAGLIQDVGQNLTDEFARRLAEDLGGGVEEVKVDPSAGTNGRDSRALDVGAAAAIPVLRRLAPLGAAVLAAALVVWLWRR
jgi:uncharacterized protein